MENSCQTVSQSASPLIDSIKSESDRQIEEITERGENELAALEKNYKDYIDTFEKENREKIENEISLEIGKLKNHAEIEVKKLNLKIIEEVIQELIREALEDLKSDKNKYQDFLIAKIQEIIPEVTGSRISIRLMPEDMFLDTVIRNVVKDCGYKGDVEIIQDDTLRKGGLVIDDFEKNQSFNNTFDRLVFRKYDIIRKNAFNLITGEKKYNF